MTTSDVCFPPVRCADFEVQRFLAIGFFDFGEPQDGVLTAQELFNLAKRMFGVRRTDDVEYWHH